MKPPTIETPDGKKVNIPEADVDAFHAKEGWLIDGEDKFKEFADAKKSEANESSESTESDEDDGLDAEECRVLLREAKISFMPNTGLTKLRIKVEENNLN